MATIPCIVVAYRDDARYALGDAVGSKVWRRRSAAETRANELNAEQHHWAPRGYVVRGLDHVRTTGAHITSTGRIVLDVPCTCPDPTLNPLPNCPYGHA